MTQTALLGDIAEKITKGTTPTTYGAKFTDKGVNFVKVESITAQGGFLTDKFVHIDIVGSGPMFTLLEENLMSAGILHLISLEGETSNPEKFFSAADICVFPSKRGEGLQGVILEAMSSGCYVLASDTQINRALLQDGRGHVLTASAAHALSRELSRIIKDEDLLKAGSLAREYILEKYSWHNVIKKLEKYI